MVSSFSCEKWRSARKQFGTVLTVWCCLLEVVRTAHGMALCIRGAAGRNRCCNRHGTTILNPLGHSHALSVCCCCADAALRGGMHVARLHYSCCAKLLLRVPRGTVLLATLLNLLMHLCLAVHSEY